MTRHGIQTQLTILLIRINPEGPVDASRPQLQLLLFHQAHLGHNRLLHPIGYLREDLWRLDQPIINKKQCLRMKKKMCLLLVILDHTSR